MNKYPEVPGCKTLEIPLRVIYFDDTFNCRGKFAPQSCFELSDSMRTKGLKMPIIVQPACDAPLELDGEYEFRIVAGHRRFTAARYLLRWKTIPATVMEGLTDDDARILNMVENLERKNLTFYQEAVALRNNYTEGTPYAKMARDLSKSSAWCRFRWKLFELPQKVITLIERGVIKPGEVTSLLYKTKEQQVAMAAELEATKLHGEYSKGRSDQFFSNRARCRKDIDAMLTKLMLEGRYPDPRRALMWAAGRITTEEFLQTPDDALESKPIQDGVPNDNERESGPQADRTP